MQKLTLFCIGVLLVFVFAQDSVAQSQPPEGAEVILDCGQCYDADDAAAAAHGYFLESGRGMGDSLIAWVKGPNGREWYAFVTVDAGGDGTSIATQIAGPPPGTQRTYYSNFGIVFVYDSPSNYFLNEWTCVTPWSMYC